MQSLCQVPSLHSNKSDKCTIRSQVPRAIIPQTFSLFCASGFQSHSSPVWIPLWSPKPSTEHVECKRWFSKDHGKKCRKPKHITRTMSFHRQGEWSRVSPGCAPHCAAQSFSNSPPILLASVLLHSRNKHKWWSLILFKTHAQKMKRHFGQG